MPRTKLLRCLNKALLGKGRARLIVSCVCNTDTSGIHSTWFEVLEVGAPGDDLLEPGVRHVVAAQKPRRWTMGHLAATASSQACVTVSQFTRSMRKRDGPRQRSWQVHQPAPIGSRRCRGAGRWGIRRRLPRAGVRHVRAKDWVEMLEVGASSADRLETDVRHAASVEVDVLGGWGIRR